MKRAVLLFLVFAGFVLACGDPFKLGPATTTNSIDTLTLFAVNGTPISKPSGFNLALKAPVLLGLDATAAFDFIYLKHATKGDVFIPFAGVNRSAATASGQAGFLRTTAAFGDIKVAEQTGYSSTDTVKVVVGDVLFVRSAVATCFLGIPYYAKLEILSIDAVDRSIRFKILINNNCGYRGLEVGLPAT